MDVKARLVELSAGVYIEEDTLRIIEKIHDYDDNLVVKYLDPGQANFTDAPYAIFEKCKDGMERLVFSVWKLDDRVIERIYAADNQRHNIVAAIENNNAAMKDLQNRRFEDKIAESHDVMASVLNSPKGTYSFPVGNDKIIKVDDSGPPKVKFKE